jgi:hypothetical protein
VHEPSNARIGRLDSLLLSRLVKKKPMTAAEMGRARWKGLTKEQRSEIARKAINARWAKAQKRKPK